MRANRGRFPAILLVFAFVSQNDISNEKPVSEQNPKTQLVVKAFRPFR